MKKIASIFRVLWPVVLYGGMVLSLETITGETISGHTIGAMATGYVVAGEQTEAGFFLRSEEYLAGYTWRIEETCNSETYSDEQKTLHQVYGWFRYPGEYFRLDAGNYLLDNEMAGFYLSSGSYSPGSYAQPTESPIGWGFQVSPFPNYEDSPWGKSRILVKNYYKDISSSEENGTPNPAATIGMLQTAWMFPLARGLSIQPGVVSHFADHETGEKTNYAPPLPVLSLDYDYRGETTSIGLLGVVDGSSSFLADFSLFSGNDRRSVYARGVGFQKKRENPFSHGVYLADEGGWGIFSARSLESDAFVYYRRLQDKGEGKEFSLVRMSHSWVSGIFQKEEDGSLYAGGFLQKRNPDSLISSSIWWKRVYPYLGGLFGFHGQSAMLSGGLDLGKEIRLGGFYLPYLDAEEMPFVPETDYNEDTLERYHRMYGVHGQSGIYTRWNFSRFYLYTVLVFAPEGNPTGTFMASYSRAF